MIEYGLAILGLGLFLLFIDHIFTKVANKNEPHCTTHRWVRRKDNYLQCDRCGYIFGLDTSSED